MLHLIIFLTALPGCFYCRTTDYYSALGIAAGFFLGAAFEKRAVHFKNTRSILKSVLRLIGGFAIFFAVSYLFKMPFSKEFLASASAGSFFLRALRYAVTTFLVIGVYPMCFDKLPLPKTK